MHMVVLLLMILTLSSKIICPLSFRIFFCYNDVAGQIWPGFQDMEGLFNRTNICKWHSCGSFGFQNIVVRNLPSQQFGS